MSLYLNIFLSFTTAFYSFNIHFFLIVVSPLKFDIAPESYHPKRKAALQVNFLLGVASQIILGFSSFEFSTTEGSHPRYVSR